MKYVDFVVQTIILGAGLVIITLFALEGKIVGGLLYAQMLIGPWQYASSLFSLFTNSKALAHKHRHFFISTLYLFFFFSESPENSTWHSGLLISFLTIIPSALAIYYYFITYKLVFNAYKGKSSFLPHLNF